MHLLSKGLWKFVTKNKVSWGTKKRIHFIIGGFYRKKTEISGDETNLGLGMQNQSLEERLFGVQGFATKKIESDDKIIWTV